MGREKLNKKDAEMVAHVVANNFGSARGNYIFYRDKGIELTGEIVEEMKKLRENSITRLEKWLSTQGVRDEAMSRFMDLLKASDWSTEESLLAFKKDVYDPFMSAPGETATELRNKLFGNPLK